jgi:hypothetical protein
MACFAASLFGTYVMVVAPATVLVSAATATRLRVKLLKKEVCAAGRAVTKGLQRAVCACDLTTLQQAALGEI